MMILSEDGMYKMLRISDSIDGQRFKQYVQREVLPQYLNGSSSTMYASQG